MSLIAIRGLTAKVLTQLTVYSYLNIIINLVICAFIVPILTQWSTTLIIENQQTFGVQLIIVITMIDCITSLHSVYYLEPHKNEFNAISHRDVEHFTLQKLETISHCDQRNLLEGDYQTKKNSAKWNLRNFMSQSINNVIQLVPTICYTLWIGYNSPFYVLSIIVCIYLYMKYVTPESVDWSEYDSIWHVFNRFKNNQYSDLIHNRGAICHTKMAECMYKFEAMNCKDKLYDIKYTEMINIMFNILTMINCYFVLMDNNNSAFIVVYIQYVNMLKNNLHTITGLFKQYKSTEKEFNNYEKIFENSKPASDLVEQIPFMKSITIANNSYFARESKIAIRVTNEIMLRKGQIVYVSGISGAGKTTLFDIMSAVTKHNDTNFQVHIDDNIVPNGFEHLKTNRIYVATDIRINTNEVSIYDIVTSNCDNSDAILVQFALTMAECNDFVTNEKLYSDKTKISKGECSRLKVARYCYDILTHKPAMILLDEIADGVDPETTVKIAENIYDYFRKNNILCLVTTHLPYLQVMKYDQEIKIVKDVDGCGIISL